MKPTIQLLGIQAGRGAPVPGAEDGPYVLRELGLVERLTSAGLKVDDLGDIPGVHETRFVRARAENINFFGNVVQVNRHTHACVLGTRRKSPEGFLLVVGGDHSLAIGTLAGLSDSCRRLGIIWIDAHADFNTPTSSPSGNLHGMSLAVACGRGHPALRQIADRDPMVDEADVYLLGCRDIDPPEEELLADSGVKLLRQSEWRGQGLVETVVKAARELVSRCDHVHLSFDVDVLDPAGGLGTGTPVPGGILETEARHVLEELGKTGCIHSAEFVEYNPELDPNNRTGTIVLELIQTLLTSIPS